ncbi:MAG: SDR family oxidoreductase [Patulibacter minatonensis]
MKIVVIGGTGTVGSKIVAHLEALGHEALAASPGTGVDTITGAGLAQALAGADAVVDAANAPVWTDDEVLAFFTTSTGNALAAAATAGVRHYVLVSIVGSGALTDSGYLRAKVAQEELIANGPLPWSIVHVTQFFEFAGMMGSIGAEAGEARVPDTLVQPIAADDAGRAIAETAAGTPVGAVEVAGPEPMAYAAFITAALEAAGDERPVIVDSTLDYFGANPGERHLIPAEGSSPHLGTQRVADWLAAAASVRS